MRVIPIIFLPWWLVVFIVLPLAILWYLSKWTIYLAAVVAYLAFVTARSLYRTWAEGRP